MEILAKLSSHEFYNQRKGLVDGAYEVVEHDGEINIAVVQGLKEPRWYDQAEWEENQESLARELSWPERDRHDWDSLLDDPNDGLEDIPPSHYSDCNGCGTCHLCDDHLSVAGDYTARNLDETHRQMNSPAFNSIHGSMGTK